MNTLVIAIAIAGMGVSALIAFLVAHSALSSRLGQLEAKIESGEKRMDRLETKFDNFFLAASISKDKDKIESKIAPLIRKLDDFLDRIDKKKNPLSTDEIDRLKDYRNKMGHGIPLTFEEYQDFQYLAKEISKDLPEHERGEFDWVIAGLLGFLVGLIIGTLIRK